MARLTMTEIDDEIVAAAASEFARHGFKYTSLQRVADAVGYSKTGLLHHFRTKEDLYQAVMHRATQSLQDVGAIAQQHDAQIARDQAAIDGLTDLAVQHPGLVLFVLTTFTSLDLASMRQLSNPEAQGEITSISESIMTTFGLSEDCDNQRFLRVISVLGAICMSALVLQGGAAPGTRDDLAAIAKEIIDPPR